ncbi:MAG TPA: AmmeMemoRadiSam system radical SAM enzyme [Candidatus Aphodovivens excrementavium]|nr:AmmeMemoRadiSam system radical SAM enzyme [Candidatus Aphodovivens excrementavium]
MDTVACELCPHHCRLSEGRVGLCRARKAVDGRVQSLSYGKVTSLALDPIEKKPLVRFHPGSSVLSVGSFGCNLSCPFCQNASIAQVGIERVVCEDLAPEELVDRACDLRSIGCIGIAYTYNEPLVGFEYVKDCSTLAHEAGLLNVLVSNGMVEREPLAELCGLIDAANIDLKGFSQDSYSRLRGDLSAVMRTIETFARDGACHLEVTTLVVPGLNDRVEEIREAARWLASLDPNITYHLTRFFPRYRMADERPTSLAVLQELAEAASEYLNDVVLGNCP